MRDVLVDLLKVRISIQRGSKRRVVKEGVGGIEELGTMSIGTSGVRGTIIAKGSVTLAFPQGRYLFEQERIQHPITGLVTLASNMGPLDTRGS